MPKRAFVFRKVFFRLNQQRLVEVLPDVVTRPLPDEGMASRTYIYIMKEAVGHLRAVLLYGKRIHPILCQGQATFRQRAMHTIGRSRCTLQGPEIHNRLIVESRTRLVQQFIGHLRKELLARRGIDGRIDTHPSGKYPIDIPVHHRPRHAVGKRTDGGSSIFAHPFQGQYPFVSGGESSCLGHTPGSRMQIPGAGVISQALPMLHHLVLIGFRQGEDIGKPSHEPYIIVVSLRHPCLLKDDFRNPNPVRVLRSSPGQVSPVFGIPMYQFISKFTHNTPSRVIQSEAKDLGNTH